jgi:Ribosomal protein S27
MCGSCSSVLCTPTGGKARLTEGTCPLESCIRTDPVPNAVFSQVALSEGRGIKFLECAALGAECVVTVIPHRPQPAACKPAGCRSHALCLCVQLCRLLGVPVVSICHTRQLQVGAESDCRLPPTMMLCLELLAQRAAGVQAGLCAVRLWSCPHSTLESRIGINCKTLLHFYNAPA